VALRISRSRIWEEGKTAQLAAGKQLSEKVPERYNLALKRIKEATDMKTVY
jgi:hypothetical protein